MVGAKAILLTSAAAAALLAAAPLAAQEAEPRQDPGETVIGPPQLRNFSLTPRERIVTQPPVEAQTPTPAQPPAATRSRPATPQPEPRATEPVREPAAPDRPALRTPTPAPALPEAPEPPQLQPAPELPAADVPIASEPLPADLDPAPAPAVADAEPAPGWSLWLLLIPGLLLAFAALFLVRRRRAGAVSEHASVAAPAVPAVEPERAPTPAPVERPWLELEFKAERTALTDEEATVSFELEIANSGKAPAANVRISARMFNAGVEQDKEIGSFFRSGNEERRTFTVPLIPPGERGMIRGTVHLKRDEVRPISVEGRSLFVPMVGVNAFYDWGEGEGGRAGQTARSYVVGRELKEKSEKMGPFRLDLGPRIWRTVGQRPHRLARRV